MIRQALFYIGAISLAYVVGFYIAPPETTWDALRLMAFIGGPSFVIALFMPGERGHRL